MSLLITGKTGTVGSNLTGKGFSSKDYDLRNFDEALAAMEKFQPTSIVHCAAAVGGLDEHLRFRKKFFYDNVLINLNVLEAARLYGVKRVLSFMSSCVYSEKSKPPLNEADIHEGEPYFDYYPYGYAKRMLDIQSRVYCEEYGIQYNCVVPTNIYGINDDFNLKTGHVVSVLIHKCYKAKQDGTPFYVWGDGSQEREFLFTGDVKNIVEWLLPNYLKNEPIVLSNNQSVTIGHVASLIAKAFDFTGEIIFESDKPSGQSKRNLSGDKLISLMDIEFTPLEEGIKRTVDWFVENYHIARK